MNRSTSAHFSQDRPGQGDATRDGITRVRLGASPAPWISIIAVVLVFLTSVVLYHTYELQIDSVYRQANPGRSLLLGGLYLALFIAVPLAGFLAGWRRGFPDWAYPFASFALLFSLFIPSVAEMVLGIDGSWVTSTSCLALFIPFLIILLAGSFVFRPRVPLLTIITNDFDDTTRVSFALFAVVFWGQSLLMDGLSPDQKLPLRSLGALIAVLVSILYLRSTRPRIRWLSLVVGAALIVIGSVLGHALIWGGFGPYSTGVFIGRALIALLFAVLPVVLIQWLLPPRVGLSRQERQPA